MPSPKRERQRARRQALIAARIAEERRRRRRNITIWGAVAALVVATILTVIFTSGGSTPTTTTIAASPTSTSPTAVTTTPATSSSTSEAVAQGPANYAGFRSQPTACGGDQPPAITEMQFDAPENQGLTGTVSATLNTSCGPIEFSLDASKYPQTVNSFVFLARKGYFDGTVCHRLAKGFVLQCGDPTAIGIGGPGYTVPDEFPPDGFVYQKGVVAMANAGPGTTGSQFFIVLGDAGFLDPTFSILGNVIGSEDTLAKLDSVPVGMTSGVQPEQSSPLETIYLDSVTIAG